MISMQSINRISFKSILSANSELYFSQKLETSVHPLQTLLKFPADCEKKTLKIFKFYANCLSESYPLSPKH